jgi:hypothetical protein
MPLLPWFSKFIGGIFMECRRRREEGTLYNNKDFIMKAMRAYLMQRSRDGYEIYPDDQEDPFGNKIDGMLYDILKDVTLKSQGMVFFMQEESIYGVFRFVMYMKYGLEPNHEEYEKKYNKYTTNLYEVIELFVKYHTTDYDKTWFCYDKSISDAAAYGIEKKNI